MLQLFLLTYYTCFPIAKRRSYENTPKSRLNVEASVKWEVSGRLRTNGPRQVGSEKTMAKWLVITSCKVQTPNPFILFGVTTHNRYSIGKYGWQLYQFWIRCCTAESSWHAICSSSPCSTFDFGPKRPLLTLTI